MTNEKCKAKSYNLSCDLKKMNSNKRDPLGDIDLFWYEEHPTKADISAKRNRESNLFQQINIAAESIISGYQCEKRL